MPYGAIKVDNITFTNGGADEFTTVSGIYRAITSGVAVTGTISGVTIQGTTVSGTTTTGTTANFASGVFTTSVSGTTITGTTVQGTTVQGISGAFTSLTGTTITGVTATYATGSFTSLTGITSTGTTASFTSGNFQAISGVTAIFTSGVIASGTAAAPSLSIVSDPNTGLYSPGADQMALATAGMGRLSVDANGFTNHTGAIGRGAPVTKTGDFTLGVAENWIIINSASNVTVTLPAASSWTGREVSFKTIAVGGSLISASSNVVPLTGGSAGTAILGAIPGRHATLVSDGTNWIIMNAGTTN